jgi:integrase
MAETKRRARGEDSIFYDRSRNRWAGTITVGWKPNGRRDRIIERGRTKTEVKDKLRTRHLELAAGVRAPARYTVEQCLKDWLETLNTQAESTVTGYRIIVRHLVELLGGVKLVELKVRDVDFALGKLAKRPSTRSVRLARMILIQAIRNAMVNDLVVRNVADLAAVPAGKAGRPSRSLNLEQALAVPDTAKGERLWPYVAVSMLGGIRTEEARALRWSEVDLEAGTVAVYRSVRRTGETKTEKSRRVFQIPEIAVEALRDLVLKQAAYRAKPGRHGRRTTWCSARGSVVPCTRPMSGWSSRGSPRRRASAGTGRRASCVTPSSRSCRIPAYPSSRSRTRWATRAPGPPRSCTGTSSARLRVPLLSRSVRCSRAEERPTEAKLNRKAPS